MTQTASNIPLSPIYLDPSEIPELDFAKAKKVLNGAKGEKAARLMAEVVCSTYFPNRKVSIYDVEYFDAANMRIALAVMLYRKSRWWSAEKLRELAIESHAVLVRAGKAEPIQWHDYSNS